MVKRAVILLSGGIDSATTMALAKNEGFELYAISFDYGQRHRRELESAKMVASSLSAKKHLIIKFDLREIGGSALTSEIEVPKCSNELRVTSYELKDTNDKKDSSLVTCHLSLIPVTYVPARNTIFLSFALAWAETLGAEDIFIGANAVDYSGYPDCRPEFLRAFEAMANLATKASVEGMVRFKINAPLVSFTKAEIIKKGFELGVDFSLTWSCYDPQLSDKLQVTSNKLQDAETFEKDLSLVTRHSLLNYVPCMRCDSCLLRARGFFEAGLEDRLTLKAKY
ncbi:MAG: 7-cyano-7-deazaguanine synthase QueC [Nitrospirae bacterium]|nr:7-cyano-7-deazaguanine synthase QueC [Nitrospirota bacterium]